MRLYTNNPISIVSAVTAYSVKLTQIVFVEPNLTNRGINQSASDKRKFRYRKKISKIISNYFQLKFTILDWQKFYNIDDKVAVIDSHLLRGQTLNSKNVLFAASDTYSIFKFSNYKTNLYTKLRLKFYWKKQIKLKKNSQLYLFGYKNKLLKKKNIHVINKKKLAVNTKLASELIFKSPEYKIQIDKEKFYMLILPPIAKKTGEIFSQEFLRFVCEYSATKKLSIILKVHPNDSLNYYTKFSFLNDCLKVPRDIPSEFLFELPNIKKILAVPSASLAFASQKKLTVLVPKNRELFRTCFLDQLIFLETNKIAIRAI